MGRSATFLTSNLGLNQQPLDGCHGRDETRLTLFGQMGMFFPQLQRGEKISDDQRGLGLPQGLVGVQGDCDSS